MPVIETKTMAGDRARDVTPPPMSSSSRVGGFVDAEHVRYNGGCQMRCDVLRRFTARDAGRSQRLNTDMTCDAERAREDPEYKKRAHTDQQVVRDVGWKITVKRVRRYTDGNGTLTTKANADLAMAADAMLQANRLDQILIGYGDGDFLQVVDALQNAGCRVELIGFKNVSRQLQQQVDADDCGFLIADLLPTPYEPRNEWGKPGSCTRVSARNGSPTRATGSSWSWTLSPHGCGSQIRGMRTPRTRLSSVMSTSSRMRSWRICS